MGGWLALGVCGVAIAILVVAALPVVARARELRHQQYRLVKRVTQVQELATSVEGIQQRAVEMEQSMLRMQKLAELAQSRMKPADAPSHRS